MHIWKQLERTQLEEKTFGKTTFGREYIWKDDVWKIIHLEEACSPRMTSEEGQYDLERTQFADAQKNF